MLEAEDFGDSLTPEIRVREASQHERLGARRV
jgi:hypothetical protein